MTGCAIAASRDEDLSPPDDGADEIARSVLPDGSLDDAGTNAQTQPPLDDASAVQPRDASGDAAHTPLDAGPSQDAAVHDAGGDAAAHDASTHDASGDATSGGSCVASQCNVSCLTRACCSVLDQCACEDVIGLCILPAL